MSVHTSADRPERLRVEVPRKALTDVEAAQILQAAEDAKNMRSSNLVVIFEYGKVERTNVYKRVA